MAWTWRENEAGFDHDSAIDTLSQLSRECLAAGFQPKIPGSTVGARQDAKCALPVTFSSPPPQKVEVKCLEKSKRAGEGKQEAQPRQKQLGRFEDYCPLLEPCQLRGGSAEDGGSRE